MKRTTIAFMLCLIAQDASAQRMRDMSLSPEESMQQPNITNSQPNNYQTYKPQPYQPRTTRQNAAGLQQGNSSYGGSANSFMAGYCDSNSQQAVNPAGLAGMQACLDTQKQAVCQEFTTLPADVRAVIDEAAGCAYLAGNNEQAAPDQGCELSSSRRLELLKRYWQDETTGHALVFLPDDVINGPARCVGGRR